MTRNLILGAALALLSGCTTLQSAGRAEYTVRPFVGADGAMQCCEVHVVNGKEYISLEAHIEKQGNDWRVDLKEQGVAAFQGQAHAAGAVQSAAKVMWDALSAGVSADGVGLRMPR